MSAAIEVVDLREDLRSEEHAEAIGDAVEKLERLTEQARALARDCERGGYDDAASLRALATLLARTALEAHEEVNGLAFLLGGGR